MLNSFSFIENFYKSLQIKPKQCLACKSHDNVNQSILEHFENNWIKIYKNFNSFVYTQILKSRLGL